METYTKVVSLPICVLLKNEYGFNEYTLHYWDHEHPEDTTVKLKKKVVTDSNEQEFFLDVQNSELGDEQFAAPFIYQVFEWLQDKGFWITVDNDAKTDEEERKYSWCITNTNSQTREFRNFEEGLFNTFEEAAEDAIRRALFILYLAE